MRKDSKDQLKKELIKKIETAYIRLNMPNQPYHVQTYWKGYLYSIQSLAKDFEIEIPNITGVNFNRF